MKKRKRYSPRFKAEIVMKVLREEQSISRIALEPGIHPQPDLPVEEPVRQGRGDGFQG